MCDLIGQVTYSARRDSSGDGAVPVEIPVQPLGRAAPHVASRGGILNARGAPTGRHRLMLRFRTMKARIADSVLYHLGICFRIRCDKVP